MSDDWEDIEDLLLCATDTYEGHLDKRWIETIYHEQATHIAEKAIEVSEQLVAGESIDYELKIFEDELNKPDFSEALKDPELLKMFLGLIKKTPQNSMYEEIKKFSEDYTRTEPRDKESPLRLIWDRISISLAQEIIEKICLGADRVLELFRLVLKTHPSKSTQQFLGRLAHCYIWGFEPECVILCRAVLDSAFRDAVDNEICEKLFGPRNYDSFSLVDRIFAAEKVGLIDKTTKDMAMKTKDRGDKAVHYQPDITKDVFGTICDTLSVIEQLQKKR